MAIYHVYQENYLYLNVNMLMALINYPIYLNGLLESLGGLLLLLMFTAMSNVIIVMSYDYYVIFLLVCKLPTCVVLVMYVV